LLRTNQFSPKVLVIKDLTLSEDSLPMKLRAVP
jgi:hypothetical protein